MRRSTVTRWAKPLIFVLCLGLLVWMVIQAGVAALWAALCSMPGTIALCVLVWGVGYLFNAASFREVLYGINPSLRSGMSYWSILRLTVTGYAINYVTPFGLLGGEPYRVLVLKEQMGTQEASRAVVLYSSMHIASHLCFWVVSALVALWMFYLERTGTPNAVEAITLAGVLNLFDWRRLTVGVRYKALAYEFVSRMINVIEYMLIMQALGFESFGYVESLLCVAFSSLFANVLFFSPMQMGTREGGILLSLQYLLPQVPQQELLQVALGLSFATRIREIIWIAIGLMGMKR